ncbi:uclacyanin 1-like [Olea europaea var. sylvestris]|uniref:uclacyanin 1-like n=1 Tax=Olea europaea var. sylvestris TaxID=158386 RepID=UPI000C1D319B|nr:uclacyanin 1-like [Olea europaea var. sylvestris]
MHRTLLSLAMIAMLIYMAKAANHTVGAPNGGWDQFTDLKTWATSQTFSPADNLFFQYGSFHNLLEVSKADYDSCVTSNPLNPPYIGGLTVIPLTNPGKRYFICGIPGHCSAGMKVEINTIAASVLAPAAAQAPPQTLATTSSLVSPVSSPSPSPIFNTFPSVTALSPAVSFPDSTTLSSATKFSVTIGATVGLAFLMVMLLNM